MRFKLSLNILQKLDATTAEEVVIQNDMKLCLIPSKKLFDPLFFIIVCIVTEKKNMPHLIIIFNSVKKHKQLAVTCLVSSSIQQTASDAVTERK